MSVLMAGMLTMAMASLSAAQDTKQDAKKDAKQEMKKDMKHEMKEGAMGMTSFDCAPECGFKVRSHDAGEAMEMGKMHAKKKHGKDLGDEDAKKMMKTEKKEMKEEMKKM
ncbi:MAG: hypothetical protein HY563_00560 [Ignavibacteriales bacterium]|nr:hypothetical protein [Ignavibacteriales bacterium]